MNKLGTLYQEVGFTLAGLDEAIVKYDDEKQRLSWFRCIEAGYK